MATKELQVVNKTYRDQRTAAEKFLDAKVKERVLNGLERLKEQHGEEWVDHITPENLRLEDASRCVLGQVYGDYQSGLRILGIGEGEAMQAGFQRDAREEYGDLTEAWLAVLTKDPYADLA